MAFTKRTTSEKLEVVTPDENEALNTERQVTGSVKLPKKEDEEKS